MDAVSEVLASELEGSRDWAEWFKRLTQSRTFRDRVYSKRPCVLHCQLAAQLVTSGAIDERVQLFEKAGIAAKVSAAVHTPRGWSYTAVADKPGDVVRFNDTMRAMQYGTLIYPEVQVLCPEIAALALAAQESTGFPMNANVYRTPPGRSESSPTHTDHHDVFVMQTQGTKRWRVWGPPPREVGRDPLLRGKFPHDRIEPEDLGAPVIDVVLAAGDVLYVPYGFPHFVQTDGAAGGDQDSVHITLALGCHEHDLSYLSARRLTLGGAAAKFETADLSDLAWFQLAEPLPLGFLSLPAEATPHGSLLAVVEETRRRMEQAEPTRFTPDQLAALPCGPVVEVLTSYHRKLVALHGDMHRAAAACATSSIEVLKQAAADVERMNETVESIEQEMYEVCKGARAAAPEPPPAPRAHGVAGWPRARGGRGRARGRGAPSGRGYAGRGENGAAPRRRGQG